MIAGIIAGITWAIETIAQAFLDREIIPIDAKIQNKWKYCG